jgi:hypothetical protein
MGRGLALERAHKRGHKERRAYKVSEADRVKPKDFEMSFRKS